MTRVVLAFAGTPEDTCAIPWLTAQHDAEVVAVTLDIGQDGDPGATRERALAAGALRAHVVEAREAFARDCVLPAVRGGAFHAASHALACPLIARILAEVGRIEGATAFAHGASNKALHEAIVAVAGGHRVFAPVTEWSSRDIDARAWARRRGVHVPVPESGVELRNLIVRRVPARVAPADAPAHVSLAFDGGMPVAINGVALALPELIDSLSLIAGQHGIAGGAPVHAPAADVLQAAYAALDGDTGEVRLRLLDGEHVVLAVSDRLSHLVMHA